jgi:hypothetical protein
MGSHPRKLSSRHCHRQEEDSGFDDNMAKHESSLDSNTFEDRRLSIV